MKNILLLVHDDEGQEARLQAALDLCRAVDGHLSCLDVTPYPVVVSGGYAGIGDAIVLLDEGDQESENKARLSQRLEHEDVSWDWTDNRGDFATCLSKAASMADLIVLNGGLTLLSGVERRRITTKTVMRSARPVLAVRDSSKGFNPAGRALIAWDGSTPALTTIRSAMPLLKLASDVRVVTVAEEEDAIEKLESLGAYLSRHGIHASLYPVTDPKQRPQDAIQAECRNWGADYCVMGAYGHGTIGEIFGGVTQTMLAQAEVPLLLGH